MQIGKFGVWFFTDTLERNALVELAQRTESLGYSALWYPEAFRYETFALGGFLLQHTSTLVVASGIANIYARDAMAAVMGHDSLNSLYGGRYLMGLGVSHAPVVADLRGGDYKQPLATMHTYLDRMDRSWEALNSQMPRQFVLAALGPKMTALARDHALGAHPYNVTPAQARAARAILGPDALLCCEQKVCLSSDADAARAAARKVLALYLPLPNYYRNWFRLGFDESDLEAGGSDRLVDALVLWGSADEIRAKLGAYHAEGATHVCIQPIRADGEPGVDWAALEALAPGA
ncbi:MAG: TIGR03620 family F420-dependent LLM class oxidoreductase [Gammaproteobacteria bacterium]|nr:TIGR03620 family F420-dependent LLM class oxidoreductase [Gammaproteobacteria bacterium]